MKPSRFKALIPLISFALLATTAYAQNSATIVNFQVPGTQFTNPASINSSGVIAGWSSSVGYLNQAQGFVRNGCGNITSFAVPGASSTFTLFPQSIDTAGDVVGDWQGASFTAGAFLRTSSGAITTPAFPGAASTSVVSINDSGEILGSYTNADKTGANFVKTASGPYQSFTVLNATSVILDAINNAGVSTGSWAPDGPGATDFHAFVRSQAGQITSFDGPSSPTYAAAINDAGQITGQSGFHGFLRNADGTLITFDVPGADSTSPSSINANGDITGTWSNSASLNHGFVRTANGVITAFDAAHSTETIPASINAAGEITGEYYDTSNVLHGFLRVPFGHADCTTASNGDSVSFIGVDTATQGAWMGRYGSAGYLIPGGNSSPTNFVTVSLAQDFSYVWAGSTSDPRALQTSPTTGIASAYTAYYGQSFFININAYGPTPQRVALYLLDWDSTSRAETVSITDASTGQTYDTESFSGFHNGEYAIWDLKGNFTLTVTPTAGPAVVVSGIFVN